MYTNRKFFFAVVVVIFLFYSRLNSFSPSDQKIVIRPSFEEILSLMVKDGCFIKKEARKKLALALKELDDIHCLFMDQFGFSRKSPSNMKDQIKKKTGILPPPVPMCERAIVFSLVLQIEMLGLVLENQDQKKALFLEEKRKRKKILSRDKKIFGDYQDVYFFLIIDLLGDISELHRCLGIESDIKFNFPTGINQIEVESYLSTKIKRVSREAKKLLYKK